MYEWVFTAIIVFLASALQAITGFGFAIMATPFLSFFIALVLTPKLRHDINYALLKNLVHLQPWL